MLIFRQLRRPHPRAKVAPLRPRAKAKEVVVSTETTTPSLAWTGTPTSSLPRPRRHAALPRLLAEEPPAALRRSLATRRGQLAAAVKGGVRRGRRSAWGRMGSRWCSARAAWLSSSRRYVLGFGVFLFECIPPLVMRLHVLWGVLSL